MQGSGLRFLHHRCREPVPEPQEPPDERSWAKISQVHLSLAHRPDLCGVNFQRRFKKPVQEA